MLAYIQMTMGKMEKGIAPHAIAGDGLCVKGQENVGTYKVSKERIYV